MQRCGVDKAERKANWQKAWASRASASQNASAAELSFESALRTHLMFKLVNVFVPQGARHTIPKDTLPPLVRPLFDCRANILVVNYSYDAGTHVALQSSSHHNITKLRTTLSNGLRGLNHYQHVLL